MSPRRAEIDLVELRKALRDDGSVSARELGRRMGVSDRYASRLLGRTRPAPGNGPMDTVNYDRAVALAEALGRDPVDVGL